MSAEYFLDTNILVYAFDQTASEKKARALQLIDVDQNWAISWQVIQEFSSVALHRFATPVKPGFLSDFIEFVLWPKCTVLPTQSTYQSALEIQAQTKYCYYDSLILAAAIESGATQLLTEDLQSGRRFGPVQVSNPFA